MSPNPSKGQEQPPAYDPLDGNYLSVKFPVTEVVSSTDAGPAKIHHDQTVTIRLRIDEYAAYFARDAKIGGYKAGVVEPEGGRKEWLNRRYREQQDPQSELNARIRESKQPVGTVGDLKGNLMTG